MINASKMSNFYMERIVNRLCEKLGPHGDFPANSDAVSNVLEAFCSKPVSKDQIASYLLHSPKLSLHIISIANHIHGRKENGTLGMADAVEVIGLEEVQRICKSVSLLQKITKLSNRNTPFLIASRKAVVTSLATELNWLALCDKQKDNQNSVGYLLGLFSEIPYLLLSYYYPNIFTYVDSCSQKLKIDFENGFQRTFGLSLLDVRSLMLKTLNIPQFYLSALDASPAISQNCLSCLDKARVAVRIGRAISNSLYPEKELRSFEQDIARVASQLYINESYLNEILPILHYSFSQYCDHNNIAFDELPYYLFEVLGSTLSPESQNRNRTLRIMTDLIQEIEVSLQSRESTISIIMSILEAFAFELGYERVLLYHVSEDGKKLALCSMIGNVEMNSVPTVIAANYLVENSVIKKTIRGCQPVFKGVPLSSKSKTVATLPILAGNRLEAMIYADTISCEKPFLGSSLKGLCQKMTFLIKKSFEARPVVQSRNARFPERRQDLHGLTDTISYNYLF